jgi:sugar O-acyltransferase (sialic acid O-acetyltransferase NeuD family)
MSRIAIFGTGGMGREVADILRSNGVIDFIFVVDRPDGPVDGTDVLAPSELAGDERIVIALGSSKDRRAVADRMELLAFTTVVSTTARISPHARVGEGSVVCDFAVINNGSRIGRHFQANCFAQVSHDCLVGDFVTLSPHVSCNGWVEIGDGVFVGAGAVIRNGTSAKRLKIGAGAVIGMGSVVTGDVPPATVVVGNPAGVIR